MSWEQVVTKLAANWDVIWTSMPLFLILAGLVGWTAFRLGLAAIEIYKAVKTLPPDK